MTYKIFFNSLEEQREALTQNVAEFALKEFQTKVQGPLPDSSVPDKDSSKSRNRKDERKLLEIANLQIQDLENSVSLSY